jgi:hypothetical protein
MVCLGAAARNGAPQLTVGVTSPLPSTDCCRLTPELGLGLGRAAGPWTVAGPRSMMRA